MNRLAVVLAADSASTVTYWGGTGKEERYFKGANKIFQLSDFRPVGLMIFDAADILRVPWEIVVKDFRSQLGQRTFNTVAGYAAEFFSFLDSNTLLFPPSVQKDIFLNAASTAALRLLFPDVASGASEADRQVAVDAAIVKRRAEVDRLPLAAGIPTETASEVIAGWRGELVKIVEDLRDELQENGGILPSEIGAFAELGILEVLKNPQDFLGTTGLVFAGFGEHEIFPAMIAYNSSGLVAGKHVVREVSREAIDHNRPAALSAFAQREMSDTFSLGISRDVYTTLMLSLADGLQGFADTVIQASGGDAARIERLGDLIEQARQRIGDSVLQDSRQKHALPLRRVLGSLPVDEMAELAETLIHLQSLKEKVTKPTETVGGPVDVAVITRSEGLVWIRRKHYFDAKLNSRYFQRQTATYTANQS